MIKFLATIKIIREFQKFPGLKVRNVKNKVKRFRAAQIQRRRDTRTAVALDGDQNPIRQKDKVKVEYTN